MNKATDDYDDGLITEDSPAKSHKNTKPPKKSRKTPSTRMRKCSIASFIIGLIIAVIFIAFISFFLGAHYPFTPSFVNAMVAVYFIAPFIVIGEIACIILSIITIVDASKQKKYKPEYIIITLTGTFLALSPFVLAICTGLISF